MKRRYKNSIIERIFMARGQAQLFPILVIILFFLPVFETLVINISLKQYAVATEPTIIKEKASIIQLVINYFSAERVYGNIRLNVTIQDNLNNTKFFKVYFLTEGSYTIRTNMIVSHGDKLSLEINTPFYYRREAIPIA